jgi:hypothetical protein
MVEVPGKNLLSSPTTLIMWSTKNAVVASVFDLFLSGFDTGGCIGVSEALGGLSSCGLIIWRRALD